MNDIFEANKTLFDITRKLIAKVKTVTAENNSLKAQLNSAQSATALTDEQKAEIEQLLAETKEVLTEEEERGLEISVDGKLTELLIDKQIKNGEAAAVQSMIAELIRSQPSAENLIIALGAYNKMLENNEEDENLKNEIIKIRNLYLKERQK